jgi:putative endonuclease
MASVYILYSKEKGTFYTGSCICFDERLAQHLKNAFPNSFTSYIDDWEVFLLIDELHYRQARNIEKHIKKMKSKIYIRNLQKYPNIVIKLKEMYQ